jgi:hypothetical protein
MQRVFCPSQTSVLVVRAHYNHACRVPVEEHVIYIAPPRAGKTGTLADVIARHPGPEIPSMRPVRNQIDSLLTSLDYGTERSA